MQKETYKQNGKRQIKEKAFRVIFETEREVIQDSRRTVNLNQVPAENDEIQSQFTHEYRKVYKKTTKAIMRH